MLENTALHASHWPKMLVQNTAFLNTLNNKKAVVSSIPMHAMRKHAVQNTKILEIPVFLNMQCAKMLENRAFHAIERTTILGITAFLNTLSNKISGAMTKILKIPVFLNTQCTKMLENRAFHAIECTKY